MFKSLLSCLTAHCSQTKVNAWLCTHIAQMSQLYCDLWLLTQVPVWYGPPHCMAGPRLNHSWSLMVVMIMHDHTILSNSVLRSHYFPRLQLCKFVTTLTSWQTCLAIADHASNSKVSSSGMAFNVSLGRGTATASDSYIMTNFQTPERSHLDHFQLVSAPVCPESGLINPTIHRFAEQSHARGMLGRNQGTGLERLNHRMAALNDRATWAK